MRKLQTSNTKHQRKPEPGRPTNLQTPKMLLAIVAAALLGIWTLDIGHWTAKADNQGYPTTLGTATNIPVFVTAAAVSNTVSWIPVSQGRGLALQWMGKMSSATSPPCPIYLQPSLDGTNISTNVWTWTVTPGGTTATTFVTNWSRAQLEGFTFLVVSGVSNAAGSGTLTNTSLVWQYPNF